MYYKIILNDGIINVIKTPFYGCVYSSLANQFIRCDNDNPQAFFCWRTQQLYYVEGWNKPPQNILNTLQTVQFEEITEEEYKDLKQRLNNEEMPVDASLFTTVEIESETQEEPIADELISAPIVKTTAEILTEEINSLKQQNEELRQMIIAILNK